MQPWFFGEYRKVDGNITNADGSVAYTLQGKWSEVVTLTDAKTKVRVPVQRPRGRTPCS